MPQRTWRHRTPSCEYEKAQGHYEEARRLYRAAKDVRGEANVKTLIGEIALSHKEQQLRGCPNCLSRCLGTLSPDQDQSAVANCLLRLGDIAMESSDFDAARDLHQEASDTSAKPGEVLGEANCLRGLGALACSAASTMRPWAHYEEALRQFRRIRNTAGEAACIIGLADVASRNKDPRNGRGSA
jgi:tetratricopeptide (TPR) repeat protein